MTKRDKRIWRMRAQPRKVRFATLESVLRGREFVSRQRGTSHVVFAHPDLEFIVPVARPHGTKDYVDPAAVEQCLEALDLLDALERRER
jgi:hypothetical protein